MKTSLNILHLEDDAHDAELVHFELKAGGLPANIKVVSSSTEFTAALDSGPYDLILSDNKLPGFDSSHALQQARNKWPHVPFIYVSGMADAAGGREKLMANGATDCVGKLNLRKLPAVIAKAIEKPKTDPDPVQSDWYIHAVERLVGIVQELSLARDLIRIMEIVRRATRELTDADGATFAVREGDRCYYADEDAIGPLWKGNRFPMNGCISGWVMLNCQPAVIEDVYADPRISADIYRPTFVKSLAMVPIRTTNPVGAIGAYWATPRKPLPEEVNILQALADSASVAIENVQLLAGLEQKAADRAASLKTVNNELEAFSYSVAHDLRAPVRHIIGFTDILREEAGDTLNEAASRRLDTIAGSAHRMGVLIDDLLEFSRTGAAELQRDRIDTRALVNEVRREMEPEIAGREIIWEIGGLPEVEGDRTMLKQVWFNLLSNAVKFTGHRPKARIRINGTVRGSTIRFAIEDNGVGFDMQFAQKLFGVFERLHTTGEFEGTGIGLATVRRIISRHGGNTWAAGVLGHGATFCFSLPVSQEPADTPDTRQLTLYPP